MVATSQRYGSYAANTLLLTIARTRRTGWTWVADAFHHLRASSYSASWSAASAAEWSTLTSNTLSSSRRFVVIPVPFSS